MTFATLAVAAISYALLQSLVAPALPTIEDELNASTTGATWILTAYLLSACVATPILGRLGDMFGKKKMLVVTLWVPGARHVRWRRWPRSIGVMIVARVIQGIGGAVFPLAFSIIRDEFPRERVAAGHRHDLGAGRHRRRAGHRAGRPDHREPQLPLAVLAAAAGDRAGDASSTMVMVPESPIRSPGRIDCPAACCWPAGWWRCWWPSARGRAGAGRPPRRSACSRSPCVLAVAWVVVEQRDGRAAGRHDDAARLRPVWTTNLSATLIGFGMFASFVLIPQFVETPTSTGYGFGASVTEAGLFLLPATVAMLLAGPVAGKMSVTVGSRVPLALGALVSALAWAMLARRPLAAAGRSTRPTFIMGLGIGLAFASMVNVIVESVRPEQTGVATGMNVIFRNIGGALGGQISASILTAGGRRRRVPDRGRVHRLVLAGGRDAAARVRRRAAGAAAEPRGRGRARTRRGRLIRGGTIRPWQPCRGV